MKFPHQLSLATLLTGIGAAVSFGAAAQPAGGYPVKPIRVIIGFAPGGPADIAGRTVSPRLSELLGQQVVIENRGGAGGTIGMEMVAKAAPDGYTLGLGSSGNMVMAPQLRANIPYNILKDLIHVSTLAVSSYVIAVNPVVPAKNVGELIKIAQSKRHTLTYGTSGAGSTSHIAAELLAGTLGVKVLPVPYKGTGPALAAVVSGEIDMMVADLTPAKPLADNGRLRLLATVSSRRSSLLPDLPTMAEAGVKMQPVDGRYGIVAPAGTPRDIVNRLHTAIVGTLKSPEVQKRFQQIGFEVIGDTPEQFSATLKTEGEVFAAVIKRAGIKVD
jgi:tripartite-type tricarboxylate transporter receptor subunit TctC